MVFHNRSNYDFQFITKELAEKFKKLFSCLGENTKKYVTFAAPLKAKMKKKIQKINLTQHNLLIAQDLWETRY